MAKVQKESPYKIDPNQTFGRPKEYDLKEEADLLLLWSKKETSLNLLEFANERDFAPQRFMDWAKRDDYFADALNRAKSQLGARRERLVHCEAFNYGAYQRGQGLYDPLLTYFEREEKKYDAELKIKQDQYDQNRFVKALEQFNNGKLSQKNA